MTRTLCCLGIFVLLAGGCRAELAGRAPDPFDVARGRLATTPRDAELHLQLALMAADRQDWLRAAQYHALVEQSEVAARKPDVVFRLGLNIAIKSRSWADAIRRCRERLQQVEDLGTRRMLALLHEEQGDLREAERQHQIILRLHPKEVEPLVEAARFYERADLVDHLDKARALYERFLDAAPDGADAATARAALQIIQLDATQPPR